MSSQTEVDVIRRLYAAVNSQDEVALAQIFAPNMVRHDLAGMLGESHSSADVTDFLRKLHQAIPDLYMELEDVFANDSGQVAARATLSGTHEGEFLGAAATGKKVTFAAITLYRFEGDRVAEAWSLVDWAGALQQMRGS
jgi:steroid delta-isomerase-like uncharacterized protein